MLEASNYIHTIEKRTGLKIACIEEIAYKLGYINKKKLHQIIDYIGDNQYGDYLKKLKMEFEKLKIDGLVLCKPKIIEDERGFLLKLLEKIY